jgi:hypothetical protein
MRYTDAAHFFEKLWHIASNATSQKIKIFEEAVPKCQILELALKIKDYIKNIIPLLFHFHNGN